MWISLFSDCILGFTLFIWISFGFGYNWIWNLEEDLRLTFVVLFCLEGLGPKGECWLGIWLGGFLGPRCWRTRAPGQWLATHIDVAWPHQSRLPPPALPARICLACPHAEKENSALVLGIGLRLWQSALGFPSLSFVYNSIVFLLLGSTDNSSSSLLLHYLLVSTSARCY